MSTGSKMYRDELRNHFQGQMQKTKLEMQASTTESVQRHIIRNQKEDDDDGSEEKLRNGQQRRQKHRMQKTRQSAEYSSLQQHQHPTQESSHLDQDQKYSRHYRQEQSKHHQQQNEREHQHCRHGICQRQPQQTTNEQNNYTMDNPCQHHVGGTIAKDDVTQIKSKETTEKRHVLSNVTKEVDNHQGANSSFDYPHSLLSIDVTPYRNKTKKSQRRQSSASQRDQYSSYDLCSESQLCSLSPMSDCSDRSLRTSKTVVSRKSAQDLREMVRSQIALQTVLDESLSALSRDREAKEKEVATYEKPKKTITAVAPSQLSRPYSTDSNQCPLCRVKINREEEPIRAINATQSEKHSMPKATDACDAANNDNSANTSFSISIDDVVNSKVINPMIRKLQRMYLNSLKEEMSLMEDLERLPHMVSEVYKASVNKKH